MSTSEALAIDIRPQSDMYATYRRIAYKVWYAIGEFVDNSTQNFFTHAAEIEAAAGQPASLTIDVTYDSKADTLTITDDANGMNFNELQRAVRLNAPPDDRSGRSEFGMGLKMAACWLGKRWRIVTKRLGSDVEYSVLVDVDKLSQHRPEEIPVQEITGIDSSLHYTRIEIEGLYRKYRANTITKINEHLSSIYRRDLKSSRITVLWNGEPLEWKDRPPFEMKLPDGGTRVLQMPVSFEASGLPVKGRVWISIPGAARYAGLNLFRRGRLVVGGPGEGFKPQEIFGAPNSFQSQRLFGELDLDNWPVTQTKDDFDWIGELEYEFVAKLREAISDYITLVEQIESPTKGKTPTTVDGQVAGDSTKDVLNNPEMEEALLIVEQGPPIIELPASEELARVQAAAQDAGEPTQVEVGTEGLPVLKIWWAENLSPAEIYAEFACPSPKELLLTVNLNHPFVTNVLQRDPEKLQLFAEMLYVDALVERGARARGEKVPPSAFRRFKDEFLRRVKPTAASE